MLTITKKSAVILAFGALIGVSTTFAWAQINRPKARMTIEQAKRIQGALYSYTVVEEFDISVGLEGGGRHIAPRATEETRHHLNIPQHYGDLIHISTTGHSAVFWFQDELGHIRNAVLPDVDAELYRLQPFETSRYKAQWIRD